jgi:hypothetical protein
MLAGVFKQLQALTSLMLVYDRIMPCARACCVMDAISHLTSLECLDMQLSNSSHVGHLLPVLTLPLLTSLSLSPGPLCPRRHRSDHRDMNVVYGGYMLPQMGVLGELQRLHLGGPQWISSGGAVSLMHSFCFLTSLKSLNLHDFACNMFPMFLNALQQLTWLTRLSIRSPQEPLCANALTWENLLIRHYARCFAESLSQLRCLSELEICARRLDPACNLKAASGDAYIIYSLRNHFNLHSLVLENLYFGPVCDVLEGNSVPIPGMSGLTHLSLSGCVIRSRSEPWCCWLSGMSSLCSLNLANTWVDAPSQERAAFQHRLQACIEQLTSLHTLITEEEQLQALSAEGNDFSLASTSWGIEAPPIRPLRQDWNAAYGIATMLGRQDVALKLRSHTSATQRYTTHID